MGEKEFAKAAAAKKGIKQNMGEELLILKFINYFCNNNIFINKLKIDEIYFVIKINHS